MASPSGHSSPAGPAGGEGRGGKGRGGGGPRVPRQPVVFLKQEKPGGWFSLSRSRVAGLRSRAWPGRGRGVTRLIRPQCRRHCMRRWERERPRSASFSLRSAQVVRSGVIVALSVAIIFRITCCQMFRAFSSTIGFSRIWIAPMLMPRTTSRAWPPSSMRMILTQLSVAECVAPEQLQTRRATSAREGMSGVPGETSGPWDRAFPPLHRMQPEDLPHRILCHLSVAECVAHRQSSCRLGEPHPHGRGPSGVGQTQHDAAVRPRGGRPGSRGVCCGGLGPGSGLRGGAHPRPAPGGAVRRLRRPGPRQGGPVEGVRRPLQGGRGRGDPPALPGAPTLRNLPPPHPHPARRGAGG